MSKCASEVKNVFSKLVPGGVKMDSISEQFGEVGGKVVYSRVYTIMRGLCANYKTSDWNYYQLSNGGFFMEPDLQTDLYLEYPKTGFSALFSPLAAGVISSLHTYSSLSDNAVFGSDVWSKNYRLLLEYVNFLPEKNDIWQAID